MQEIKDRLSKEQGKDPLHVTIEHKDFGYELILIDTPGLGVSQQVRINSLIIFFQNNSKPFPKD